MPKNRVVSDTRKLVYYYRASPDRRRILFGGRVAYQGDRSEGERATAAPGTSPLVSGIEGHQGQP